MTASHSAIAAPSAPGGPPGSRARPPARAPTTASAPSWSTRPATASRGRPASPTTPGVSRSTISRLLRGRINPSFRLAQAVTAALEKHLRRPLDLRELLSPDGTYPTASGCALAGCRGCMPEEAYDAEGQPPARVPGPAPRRLVLVAPVPPATGHTPANSPRKGGPVSVAAKIPICEADFQDEPIRHRLRRRLLALSYHAFARCLCLLLARLGYEDARPAGRTRWKGHNREGGYDIEAWLPVGITRRRVVVQAKQFDARPVFQRSVDELRGTCLRAWTRWFGAA